MIKHTLFAVLFVVLFSFLTKAETTTLTTCTVNELGDETCVTTTTTTTGVAGVTTDNLLSNDFQDGSWTHTNQDFHGSNVLATTGNSTSSSTVSLTDDAGLSKTQINAGFSSTLGADIWFWSGYSNKVILRQTLTDDNGNVTTQYREITGTSNNYGTNYTDTIIVGSNSQQNYNITASLENTAPGNEDAGHIGPDIDNPSLIVTTNDTYQTTTTSSTPVTTLCQDRVPNACTYDQEAVEEAVTVDVSTDTGQTYDEYVEEAVQYIEVEEIVSIETSIIVEDDLGIETEMTVEEFVTESFTSFLEENGLQEEFTEALDEEGITEQEFFSAVADEMESEFSSEVAQEESVEEVTNETEMEESTEVEPTETNDTQNEVSETDSNETESTQTEDDSSAEQEESSDNVEESVEDGESNEESRSDNTEAGEVEVENGSEIQTKIAKVISKLEKKLKNIDQKLKAISVVTAQIMIEQQPDMSSYTQKEFYTTNKKIPDNKDWYAEDTILDAYGRSIYQDKTLIVYQTNDPLFQYNEQVNTVNDNIRKLEAELEVLKNENTR